MLKHIFDFFRKTSFLSLRSLNISPSVSRTNSPSQNQSQLPGEKSTTPRQGRKSLRRFFKRPSFFNKIQEHDEHEEPVYQSSSFAQIYKNAKFRLSRSFASKSSSSSQVRSSFINENFPGSKKQACQIRGFQDILLLTKCQLFSFQKKKSYKIVELEK